MELGASTIAVATPATRAVSLRRAGRAVLLGDGQWDLARQAWNLAVDQRPAAVALPESAEEARSIVEYGRAHDLRIAPQTTGHGALSVGSLEHTILLKTAGLRGVEIDPVTRRATVQAGSLWGEVTTAAAGHGLAGLAGSSPTVGVIGYSLGGGIGWLARRYGLAANSILAADIVTGDGRFVRADSEREPDLLWAIRGGGGSFGVVTALEMALFPVRQVYGGALFWPLGRAPHILRAWRAWTDYLPDDVTSIARVRRMPSRSHIPQCLRGRSVAIVEAAYVGAEAEGIELLRPLRALSPEIDTFRTRPMTELGPLHLDPHEPMPRIADGYLLADFPPAAVDAMLASATVGTGSPLASVEVRHLGGALARRSPEHGALASLDASFALYAVGMAGTPGVAAAVGCAIDALRDALAPWGALTRYPNFADRGANASDLYPAETYDRLRRIKAAYDPDAVIASNHPIELEPAGRRDPRRRTPARTSRPDNTHHCRGERP